MAHTKNKREIITDAAKTLFAGRGFNATTTDAVAKEAGVAVGTIYNYFQSKDDLLSAIFREALDRRVACWQALGSCSSPVDRIRRFIAEHFREIGADPRLGIILVQCLSTDVEGVRSFHSELQRRMIEALSEAVERGELACDAELTAVALLGMVEALVREGVRRGERVGEFFARATRQVSDVLEGLRVR